MGDSTDLNAYAVAARYPYDFEDSRSIQDAKDAYGFIVDILEAVLKSVNVKVESDTLKLTKPV